MCKELREKKEHCDRRVLERAVERAVARAAVFRESQGEGG